MLPPKNTAGTPCWLVLRLPHLALDLATRGLARPETPVAISDTIGRSDVLLDCNPAAARAGVRPGMPAAAAQGILDTLQVLPRDLRREYEALQGLAAWCYQYSSQVSLPAGTDRATRDGKPLRGGMDARRALWLEAAASERLFGPPEELGPRLERELGRLGYHARAGSAPTPEAAWLAAGEALHLDSSGAIRTRLGALPLDRLHVEPTQIRAMESMGFRTLRDLLRLPRKAVTRRFGPATAATLDRVLGLCPDPRPAWHPPETFDRRLELPAEINATQALAFPLKRLLEELCGVLRGGDTAVQALDIALRHEDHDDTRLRVGTQSPTQDAERLLRLTRERLERLRLPQAVREIRLQATNLLPLAAGQHSLFRDSPAEQRQDIERLAERLQARLGRDAVSGVTGIEDHRPEYSWRPRALDEHSETTALAHRPSWLLHKPRRCDIAHYRILAGPERIESGWWDGRDCRRDYFVVRDAEGSTLWAFHEYKPCRGWFVHGVFG
ncbi:Y-family DNA polymerase [Elongatibacter sediminis]|uniref:DNA polymerase Y family protein n=1 Tax=Elongatibacter sediminis TaxID=3119006 RepID=A0AAW9RG46_9GAMM